ncbi:Uncharacterised protein [Myroides odoratus]|uniref:Uncharacterized protein n=1 Tax=Myroides odoratus TaxID=256 RepID=A0A378RQM0_MYROD|nr:hypothetical protein [Myroides odoratus]QQU04033.1 hypothetical protein I6I89_01685 [Myroides odoratus]STZ28581.1 Uncharacterised protein [Myroides odoratus]
MFTWEDLEILACGRIGLDINYFYSLTPRQFNNIQLGWNENNEMQIKTSWEQTRKIFEAVLRPYMKDKTKTAKDLLPLPWDTEEVHAEEDLDAEQNTFEEMQERWRLIDEKKKVVINEKV